MATAVASRYARALADLACDPRRGVDPSQVATELAVFEQALAASGELRNILLSPAVPVARKRAVVSRLSEDGGISRLVRNFLFVVVDHRRIGIFDEIREAFQSEIDSRLGLIAASVRTARPLSEARQATVVEGLESITGKRVRPNYGVDPELIGGMVVRIGSTIYDGSVRGQLETLRRKLMD